jgi:hypothetical protein
MRIYNEQKVIKICTVLSTGSKYKRSITHTTATDDFCFDCSVDLFAMQNALSGSSDLNLFGRERWTIEPKYQSSVVKKKEANRILVE